MWGGGGGMGGFGGGGANRGSADAGLPFAGMPPEMVPLVERLIKDEPDHPVPKIDFSQNEFDRRPVTLRRLFRPYKWSVLGVFMSHRGGDHRRPARTDPDGARHRQGHGPRFTGPAQDRSLPHVPLRHRRPLLRTDLHVDSRRVLPHPVGGQAHRAGDLPAAGARLLPLPAHVARLLHRRAGRPAHDPHDRRHREPAALPAGRRRPAPRAGPHPDRAHRAAGLLQPPPGRDHPAPRGADHAAHDRVVPARL